MLTHDPGSRPLRADRPRGLRPALELAAPVTAVRYTSEIERILRLPRRTQSASIELALEMSEALRKDTGAQQLRPVQALALLEAMMTGGLFGPIGVGEGKTLITLLAPYVLEAKRYLLILPAGLQKKTRKDHAKYAQHWRIPALSEFLMLSYEMLGRVQSVDVLNRYKPDLIGADEVHRFKNRRAACTRRMIRYMHDHPETRFLALSGTIMQKSVRDFGHILRWCLKDKAPVPRTETEIEDWAWALDERVPDESRYEPGALLRFCEPEELNEAPLVAARRGFRRRLLDTPGVVSTIGEGERVNCSLYVSYIKPAYKPVTEQHFHKLRRRMLTPDDWVLTRGAEVWQHARELSLGCHYVWDPRPPEDWRNARRDWGAFVREILSRSRTLDSEKHVALEIDAGRLRDGGVLKRWRDVRDTFRPNSVAVWHDDSVLKLCAEWMSKGPGIVWTEHAHFAEKLSALTGVRYFGAKGFAADGTFIDDAEGPIIASIDANKEGRNLQHKWSRNMFTTMPDNADLAEQVIGRTHRPLQEADEVTVDVLLGCLEHVNAFRKALSGAQTIRDTVGAAQKLLIADIDWPSDAEIDSWRGARWERTPDKQFVDE